ncbi:elongation factor G [Salinarimonas ramus]|uniref:Elongation factor G n=1 Tax=Salinarimonas ramus TaxID=690164 RepID=A0A917QDR8_9HYPH|nr:elongation factor G [Salinarimonas ramus]GGK45601.1 elongation factor G [Salinarimonas ramus]
MPGTETLGGAARCVAIVGPFQSGKTTLMESLLERAGAVARAGSVAAGTSVGDASREARAHAMSTELNVASADFLGETFHFVDCPGSVELAQDMRAVLPACDAAIVVCEADERKIPALEPILRELEEADVPRFLFLNKIDTAAQRVRETLALLQRASRTPLLLRQIPIWKDGIAIGFVDLALERAFIYREHAPSRVVESSDAAPPDARDARFQMLERLADYDDALMEELLSDIEPPRDRVFDDLARELRERHVVPVLFGSAERGNGVTRLFKALRHEAPRLAETRARLGVAPDGAPLAQIVATRHTSHGGKLSVARVLRGRFAEGDGVVGSRGAPGRIAGILALSGEATQRVGEAGEGALAGFAKLDAVVTGESVAAGRERPDAVATVIAPDPVHSRTIHAPERKDEAKLAACLAKLADEDPALVVRQDPESGELRLSGQGEMHLRLAVERLLSRFGLAVDTSVPAIAYRETIRKPASARARHKKQTGGHGQFADVAVSLAPLPRGEGFLFGDTITGGVVPKQWIPSVGAGAEAALASGPNGHPVVDVAVTLTDGGFHAVDSSDAAFQAAGRAAVAQALAEAGTTVLEPVLAVEIVAPSDAISKATQLVSARRGQIQAFAPRPGWEGWDVLTALVPEAEMDGFIVDLRSSTAGVGTFRARFDHLAEVVGKPARALSGRAG